MRDEQTKPGAYAVVDRLQMAGGRRVGSGNQIMITKDGRLSRGIGFVCARFKTFARRGAGIGSELYTKNQIQIRKTDVGGGKTPTRPAPVPICKDMLIRPVPEPGFA